jgi:3-dehydroquinate synthase II
MARIPLWIDLRHVAPSQLEAVMAVAKACACERVLVGMAQADSGEDHGADSLDLPFFRVADGTVMDQDVAIGAFMPVIDAQTQAAAADASGVVIVEANDWTIIPLENLIAAREDRPDSLFGIATSAAQAGVFRDTLDRGVHGVVLQPQTAADVAATHEILLTKGLPSEAKAAHVFALKLVAATITAIDEAGPGDRVCVDTTSILEPGEGLLVGSTARSFILVHGETIETEFVGARPFRVNAGAVHSYLMGPSGRTQYLSEVGAGSSVLAVSANGSRTLTVGRAKIEHRPHFLVRWKNDDGEGSAMLQNAETIRLVRPGGDVVSVTALKVGDEVMVHHETKARHFGMPVDERLEEK